MSPAPQRAGRSWWHVPRAGSLQALMASILCCADDVFERALKATAPEAHSGQAAWGRQLAAAAHALLQDWAQDCA